MRLLLSISLISLCLPVVSLAGSKAAWPFNTPAAEAKGICGNAADHAEDYIEQMRRYRPGDPMINDIKKWWQSDLKQLQRAELRNDPRYAAWTNIYFREVRRYLKMVERIPHIKPSTAKSIVEDRCSVRIPALQQALERTEPSCERDWLGRCKD